MPEPTTIPPFDWDEDSSLVIRSRRATAVYANQYDCVVILQEGYLGGDEPLIVINPDDIPQLIKALQAAAKEAKQRG